MSDAVDAVYSAPNEFCTGPTSASSTDLLADLRSAAILTFVPGRPADFVLSERMESREDFLPESFL